MNSKVVGSAAVVGSGAGIEADALEAGAADSMTDAFGAGADVAGLPPLILVGTMVGSLEQLARRRKVVAARVSKGQVIT